MRSGDPEVFNYVNYRKYLQRWFKARNKRPSMRLFADGIGRSHALVSGIVNRKKKLAPVM